jgi:hypothetical protein
MKFWEDIVSKAILGSSKQHLQMSDIPELITQEFELNDTQDPEEDFLRFSSLAYQFRQGGSRSLNFSNTQQAETEEETKPYCSSLATNILKTILEEEHYPLLELWLLRCSARKLCVPPEIIPALLDIAVNRKELRKLILQVSGKRGEWLCRLNSSWNFNTSGSDWETGKAEERKELLRNLREQNPGAALELLKTTWASEGANEKVTFLEILSINLSSDDLSWLEGLKEKGQKVNSAIHDLLTSIPTSGAVRSYWSVLKDAVNVKPGKALLGMISKTTLEIRESIEVPEIIFKSGIEKLSSDKNISDHQHILRQLISAVPPSTWNDHLQLSTDAVLALFKKEKETTIYIPALALAAAKFKDNSWAKSILEHVGESLDSISIVTLLSTLPGADCEIYARKLVKERPEIIQFMANQKQEWSMELAKMILNCTAREIYAYNKSFYRSVVTLIPVEILTVLDSFEPAEEQKKIYWKNQSVELARLLTIKQQTLQSFTA